MKSDFKIYKYCRFCQSKNIIKIIDLGKQPLAGGFLKNRNEFNKEKAYPLRIYFCKKCFLVQTDIVINKNTLFKKYYYSSSKIKTLVNHFETFGEVLKERYTSNNFVIEIGSNDGLFLKILNKLGFKTLGIDPSENLTNPLIKKGVNVVNDYFSTKLSKKIIKKFGQADIVVSSNTLAHIENMHDVANGIKIILKDDGILVFENHYLTNLIKELQYDMIYHEHQYYYSIMTLINFFESHNMEIYNVEKIKTHAGSIRVYVQKQKTGKNIIKPSVRNFIKNEQKIGLNKLSAYNNFEKNIKHRKNDLLNLIKKIKLENKSIVGYGASGRATVISNFCNLNHNILDYVIDDSKLKQGLYTPGNHLKIVSSNLLYGSEKPNYVLVFAWPFIKEIFLKNKKYIKEGGKFILPLPKVKII